MSVNKIKMRNLTRKNRSERKIEMSLLNTHKSTSTSAAITAQHLVKRSFSITIYVFTYCRVFMYVRMCTFIL